MTKKLSIGTWAYIFNQEKPTNDFHEILHKLQHLGYEGVELGSFGVHPTPVSHPTKASREKLKKEIADHGLALVCKRLGLSRAAFSTLAMLMAGNGDTAQRYAALDSYDAVTGEAIDDLRAAHNGHVINFPREPRGARAS